MSGHVCAECGRPLPIGGVLSEDDKRVHHVCAALIKRRIADLAQQTARQMVGGRPARQRGPAKYDQSEGR